MIESEEQSAMADLFNPAPIPKLWVEQILAGEHDDRRFEHFAAAIASALEGRPVVVTSASWDRGRDGRSVGGGSVYVITSLEGDVNKPVGDAKRLKSTTPKIKSLYYATRQPLSEHTLDAHVSAIRDVVGSAVEIEPLGGIQLVDLVSNGKGAEAFRKHYAGEIAGIQTALHAAEQDEAALQQLELALSTFGASDTHQLRHTLLTRLILSGLKSGPASTQQLAASSGELVGVDTLPEATIAYHADQLRKDKLVQTQPADGQYVITPDGTAYLERSQIEVVSAELKGLNAVRAAVEESVGQGLPEQQWAVLWKALQTALARTFYMRGKQLLDVLSALLRGDASSVSRDTLAPLVDGVLVEIVGRHVAAPNRPVVLRALQDAFLPGDKHGAFGWLADVAGRFAAICTLGLPQEIASGVRAALASIRFFFDTDVIISYLCDHEPAHVAAKSVADLSRRLGHPVMITDAVAEETARHAAKAQTDHRMRVAPIRRGLTWYEIAELESAFTREFEYLRLEGKAAPQQWTRFIERYTGPEERGRDGKLRPNVTRMRQILSKDSFAVRSAGPDPQWQERRDLLAKLVYEDAKRRGGADHEISQEKARIDAEMLLAVAKTMQQAETEGKGERFVLITSARRLRYLSGDVRRRLPEVPEVISLPEAACLASLLPGQPLSLKALHALLFEGHFADKLGGLESMLLRIVRGAGTVVLPGASRGLLLQEFSDSILREARRTGESRGEVRARIDRNPVDFARVAATAIDALALQQPSDREEILSRLEAATKPRPPRSAE